jgi:hypothetical protein
MAPALAPTRGLFGAPSPELRLYPEPLATPFGSSADALAFNGAQFDPQELPLFEARVGSTELFRAVIVELKYHCS